MDWFSRPFKGAFREVLEVLDPLFFFGTTIFKIVEQIGLTKFLRILMYKDVIQNDFQTLFLNLAILYNA